MYLPAVAFISSNNEDTYSPWSISEKLCMLEIYRDLSIGLQARHLFIIGVVDDVLTANAYALAEELEAHVTMNPNILTFGLVLEKELTRTEQKILDYEPGHVVRSGMGEYMMYFTWPRVTFADGSIPTASTRDLRRGDAVILGDGYLKYKGELHIVSKDMPSDERKNVIGRLSGYKHILLSYAGP